MLRNDNSATLRLGEKSHFIMSTLPINSHIRNQFTHTHTHFFFLLSPVPFLFFAISSVPHSLPPVFVWMCNIIRLCMQHILIWFDFDFYRWIHIIETCTYCARSNLVDATTYYTFCTYSTEEWGGDKEAEGENMCVNVCRNGDMAGRHFMNMFILLWAHECVIKLWYGIVQMLW